MKKMIPAILSTALILSISSPASAVESSSGKEEVVYAMTDASGTVTGVYVVNIFGSGDTTDYGDYSEVKMLNTNDPISQDGDTITFSSSAERVYYEGTLKNLQIPWNISIRYFMDGTAYSPNEIAGKSGSLKIQVSIQENPKCNSTFFDHYALEVRVPLDTALCTDIQAEGSTEADAGSDKRLTYIILPGNEKILEINANVVDFEIDSIEIVGLLLNVEGSFDFDASNIDLSNFTESITALQNGTKELNAGANELYGGTAQLIDGASGMQNGATALSGGLDTLSGKSNDLLYGAQQLADAVFTCAAAQLRTQLIAAGMGEAEAAQITLTQSNYTDVITKLSGDTPTQSLIASAERTIRARLSDAGLTETDQQSLAMTLAEKLMGDEGADSVNNALTLACSMFADAAYVQAAVAAHSADPALNALAAILTDAPYNIDMTTATAVACTAIALDSTNPSAQLTNAMKNVRSLRAVSGTVVDNNSIQSFCVAAAKEQMTDSADDLASLKTQLDGIVNFLTGISAYTGGVADAASGAESVASGASKLVSGACSLRDGAEKLAEGTNELMTKTDNTDLMGDVQKKIDDVIRNYSNDNYSPISFVSERNTNTKFIQFVIKTTAVKALETEQINEEITETLTFWQKLLHLFGLH
ncbi:MAG: hypothetical protein GX847_11820 [Clostridiales bacterium]|nr:hypothetical protein [Clostridiales bacterium]